MANILKVVEGASESSAKREPIEAYAVLFHALSDPTRLQILRHLVEGEHRVRDLVDHLGLAQSTVSVHLRCLRDCGLVASRTQGRSSWFSLSSQPNLDALLAAALPLLPVSADAELHTHLFHRPER